MNLTIHRGTHEIGGSCVELVTDKSRLILDMGMPLMNSDGSPYKHPEDLSAEELRNQGILPNIADLYCDSPEKDTHVVISHAHQDHYGFLKYLHPNMPVYMTAGTKALIDVSTIFLRNIEVSGTNSEFKVWKPIAIGDYKVTPYLVDHSAPDAVSFLIEADGKRIFYTGDFRSSGRKGKVFDNLLERPPKDIDYLLVEGTMVGRKKQKYVDEVAIEEEFVNIFSNKDNLAFIFASGQNVDRLVSAFRAAIKTDSIFVIDLYSAFILDKLKTVSKQIPQYSWDNVRVKYWKNHADTLAKAGLENFLFKVNRKKIEVEEIAESSNKIVMFVRANSLVKKITDNLPNIDGTKLIWSMWSGYLTDDSIMKKFANSNGLSIEHVHTSGHATVEDLKRFVDALNPKTVIPMHTMNPDKLATNFDNALVITDGETIEL